MPDQVAKNHKLMVVARRHGRHDARPPHNHYIRHIRHDPPIASILPQNSLKSRLGWRSGGTIGLTTFPAFLMTLSGHSDGFRPG